jgi:hypothetical protein
MAPPVFSTVPAEFNIFNPSLSIFFHKVKSLSLSLTSHWLKTDGFYAPSYKYSKLFYNMTFFRFGDLNISTPSSSSANFLS